MAETKKRRVGRADWDKVEAHVNEVYSDRKTSKRRKEHERKWKEVDRQIEMEPLQKMTADGKKAPPSWESAIELGELSSASEIITDDVMRIMFPQDRFFFQPHVELRWPIDEKTGRPKADNDKQEIADGLLRALMAQQMKDFGFKARFRLSVKESMHHGSFVAEARFEEQMMVREGDQVRILGAPVWVPYSMWNAYPDPSASVIGTNMFYTGSMVLVEYMPLYKLKQIAKGDGYMADRLKLIKKQTNKNMDDDTEDVELIKFKGDVSIERGDGDIYLPNSEVILANGKLVYWSEGRLPYPNVIFAGYERQDVRDPYYSSPIIKMSPTHKMTTIIANEFVDGVKLKIKPPIEYDSNDPDYAQNDGPIIAPGAKTGTRSMGQGMRALDIGEPKFALDAYILGVQQMKEGLGVSANRAGVRDTDRETATAANLANQGAEVRTMGFIGQLEPQALLPFLYMQHELNRANMEEYTFYNDEMHTPDFVRAQKKDIQANAHFEVVGSRGLLGEEQRNKNIANVTAFFSGNPLFAPKLHVNEIMLEMYRDAGKKNPEEFIMAEDKGPQIPPQIQQAIQEMQQIIQQLGQENQQLKSKHDEAMAKIALEAKKLAADQQQFSESQRQEQEQFNKEFLLKLAEFKAEVSQSVLENRQNVIMDVTGKAIDIEKMMRERDNTETLRGDMNKMEEGILQHVGNMIKESAPKKGPRRKTVVVRGKRIPVTVEDDPTLQ